jgi:hypothetical protein
MFTRYANLGYWGLPIVGVALARLALGQAGATPVIIGIALPQGQLGQSAQVAEPMRQSLIDQLRSQSVEAVPLTATSGSALDGEAQAKHCSYVLYIRLEQKHGMGGMFSKLAPLASALPFGALAGHGGANAIANTALQGAANAAATSAQEHAVSQLTGAAQSNIKRGDTVALDYRLVPVGSTNPTKADTFSGKADADGQDVVSPLVAQLTSAVVPLAKGEPSAQSTPPRASGDTASSNPHASLLGGFFGHGKASDSKPTAGAGGSSVDCAKLTGAQSAVMSPEVCQQLQGAQQTYNQAASDPRASHPGDDQMTCDQITAELRQQQYSTPDKSKVAAAQATLDQQQAILKREEAYIAKTQAEDQAVVAAATAADTATELATGGLVRGRSLQAAEKTMTARNDAHNEKVLKETQPIEQQQVGQMAGFASGAGQQLQSNPRLARLMQLADAKRCKGGV